MGKIPFLVPVTLKTTKELESFEFMPMTPNKWERCSDWCDGTPAYRLISVTGPGVDSDNRPLLPGVDGLVLCHRCAIREAMYGFSNIFDSRTSPLPTLGFILLPLNIHPQVVQFLQEQIAVEVENEPSNLEAPTYPSSEESSVVPEFEAGSRRKEEFELIPMTLYVSERCSDWCAGYPEYRLISVKGPGAGTDGRPILPSVGGLVLCRQCAMRRVMTGFADILDSRNSVLPTLGHILLPLDIHPRVVQFLQQQIAVGSDGI